MNGGEGRVPGATSKLTNPVTVYVPLPAPNPVVVQVPPPVTSCGLPGLSRKVPLPVSVIMLVHEVAVQADALPPGKVVMGWVRPEMWMMSHRYWWLDEPALAPAGTSRAAAQVIAAASPTGMSLAAFIACSSLLRSGSAFGERAAAPHNAMPRRGSEFLAQARRRRPGIGASFLAAQEGQPAPKISARSAGIGAL